MIKRKTHASNWKIVSVLEVKPEKGAIIQKKRETLTLMIWNDEDYASSITERKKK